MIPWLIEEAESGETKYDRLYTMLVGGEMNVGIEYKEGGVSTVTVGDIHDNILVNVDLSSEWSLEKIQLAALQMAKREVDKFTEVTKDWSATVQSYIDELNGINKCSILGIFIGQKFDLIEDGFVLRRECFVNENGCLCDDDGRVLPGEVICYMIQHPEIIKPKP